MSVKKGNDYFVMLSELVEYSFKAATLLNETLENFNIRDIDIKIKDMHTIEHEADLKKHEMIDKLSTEFITPIERGDIIELSQMIDNITDVIEDVLVSIYTFNVKEIRKEAIEFSKIVLNICSKLKRLMYEFKNFKKSNDIQNIIITINDLEEEGDRLYTKTVRSLFVEVKDPIELIVWKEVLEYLEKCCDACEDVAEGIESIVMKNS